MYDIISYKIKMSLSSKWLGHFPFKEETRVQVPLGLPINLRTNKLKDNEIEYICTTS